MSEVLLLILQTSGVDVPLLEEIRDAAVAEDGPSLATLLPVISVQFHEARRTVRNS